MFKSVRTKVIVAFACVFAAVFAVVAIGSFQLLHQSEHASTDYMGYTAAQVCAASVGYFMDDSQTIDPDSETYRLMREDLRELCKDIGMAYLYAYYCDVDAGTVTYLICVAASDEDDELVARERSYGTVVNVDFSDQQLSALRDANLYQARVAENEFGSTLSWYDKVDGADNLIAGADYSIGEQRARVMRTTAAVVTLIALALLALLLVQLRLLQTGVFRPLRAIAGQMKSFRAERAEAFEPLDIQTHDEMGEIAVAFESMADDIGAYLRDIERLTTERVQGRVELDVARRIQLGMVPERTDAGGMGYQVCAVARPARQVGGDFYDCLELDGGKVAVVIGDVSGKGVAAALFMAMTKTMIHEGLASGKGPADVLNRVNAGLCQSNPEGMFVTAFAAVLEPESGEVRFANAGHMPPLAIGRSVRRVAVEPGTLLGLFDDIELQEGSLVLGEGEALLLFTDGVTEAVSADKAFLGAERLMSRLAANAPYADAQAIVAGVVELVTGFTVGREQFDDLTAVAFMRCIGEGAGLPAVAGEGAELAVDAASFATVREEIFRAGIDEPTARRACLACEEAFVNIVSYSGARNAWFAVAVDDGELSVTFTDDGAPFDPTSASVGGRQFEDLDDGGMGIGLIRQMTSRLSYRRERNRNVLELRFELSRKGTVPAPTLGEFGSRRLSGTVWLVG